ncbi:type I restriction endonuclease subunit R [Microvirga massiliensis]|uniref:type I restriction endonuclease subunit R n=1 Tax=Microvirga massiliensis TaxID=1033741 RepID=UPI00062BD47C|nr:DEAD/DEAH box helicase family protein [Microvirga massiliensis]
MTVDYSEKGFENAIEASLLSSGGYRKGDPKAFDAKLGLTPTLIIEFLKASQPKEWARLEAIHGPPVEINIVALVARELDQRGTLDILRHGITDHGVKIRLAYFKPATSLNPQAQALYEQNILTITRQVHHSPTGPSLSLDVVLSVNGLPVATAELKNPFTSQTVEHAKRQYKFDRNPNDPVLRFKTRALVHFAVDPDLVFMTTRLERGDTTFLPFNKGNGTGAGNPPNPNGYKTAYLWEEVWAKDRWMEILARFAHLEVKERKLPSGKKVRKESIIFPRYHQLDAVTKVLADVWAKGVGQNYLIEHSAGSGKSNSIAWLAHRLASLHDTKDEPIFSSVIVITDRLVLDKQLQDTIYQFEHKQGVVEKIDTNSGQLAAALNAGTPIIISTLQKFSFILKEVEAKASRRYAVIVDEAHSSQTGESATNLKKALAASSLEKAEEEEKDEGEDTEDEVLKAIRARGRQPNISFFAFTATPKKKTVEIFGTTGPDGKPRSFHLYSMRQAIEEGFILDVLKNYVTYETYYRFEKAVEDDPQVDKSKAKRAIARYASIHPHNLAQKAEVMIEHFRAHTRQKIGGKAKAMVVTRSRLHAVRYRQTFEAYIAKKGYTDLGVLVAFSGTVIDEGDEYTEAGMNSFGERELPERFGSDDYQVLIVAEKYQTGFDQPLLHTMYVDKKLKDLKAVQTLSRLNRTCAGKVDTFVLDFENTADEIKEAFKPYYEEPEIDQPTDPNQLYGLKTTLDGFQFYWQQEVEDFARVFFKPEAKQKPSDQGLLHKAIDPAVGRFKAEPDEERQEEFRANLDSFVRLYGFVSQIMPFEDVELEKLYAFLRLLRTKLPKREGGGMLDLEDDVSLAYYRLEKTFEGSVSLTPGETGTLTGPTAVGTHKPNDEAVSPLSEVIRLINDRFGTDFSEEDRLLMEQVVGDLGKDEGLAAQARSNTLANFRHVFDPRAMEAVIERMERNEAITEQFMANDELRGMMLNAMMREFYERARSGGASGREPTASAAE